MDEQLFSRTFVELADTLVAGFDVIDFLHLLTDRSLELLKADSVGLMLASVNSMLEPLVATDEHTARLEEAQVRVGQGPCVDAYRTGRPVHADNVESIMARWPVFSEHLQDAGFVLVQALPMRLRDQRIGAMNLFRSETIPFKEEDVQLAQALADVATIGLIHERALAHSEAIAMQLQRALDSRVIIEQAKGKLAERTKLDPDVAFQLLRDYSRSHNYRLSDLADTLVHGSVEALPGLLP